MRQIETVVQSPLSSQDDLQVNHQADGSLTKSVRNPFKRLVARWLNRDLPPDRRIELRVGWPLWLFPVVLINQLVAPHVVWVVFVVALAGFYLFGYLWVRSQAPAVRLTRHRIGSILVAGDLLQEEFELQNDSPLPVLWAEFIDRSTVPEYQAGRIAACEGHGFSRWRTEVLCKQRGLFRLGPHLLRLQDPLGLFAVTVVSHHEDVVVIYPRVVHLPHLPLPRGNAQGTDRQRRPMPGNLPAATVSDYQPGDSLRHVHWVSTARRGRMMVKELEIEPSGNIWVILDLDQQVQQGDGPSGTLEHGIVVAASLAADLLTGREQRAVGLLAFSGKGTGDAPGGLVQVAPGVGSAHLWQILTALAPVAAGELSLAALLASSRDRIGRRGTLTIVTPASLGRETLATGENGVEAGLDWIAELVHLKGVGVNSSVILTISADADPQEAERIQMLLARMEIPCSLVAAGEPLPALLTFRRRRSVVRATPTGGVERYEVDEEVG